MKLHIIKDYDNERAIAVVLRGKIYNQVVTYNLCATVERAMRSRNFKALMGIINRNDFVERDYEAGVTPLWI